MRDGGLGGTWWAALAVLALVGGCGGGGKPAGPDGGGDAAASCVEAADCNDDDACTVDECRDGVCAHAYDEEACCTSDQCEIDGACFDNGEPDPEGPCRVCRVAEHADAWSLVTDAECDDGDPCTVSDVCVAGECVGEAYDCDDDNPCTDDVCGGDGSCEHVDNEAPCEDGDACTTGDTCAGGSCQSGEPLSCDDDNECTADACDPATGCSHEPLDGISCDDADVCSLASQCEAGSCVPTEVDDCDDGNVCTSDFCDPVDGCGHEDLAGLCDDGNPCTDDSCDPTEGCVYDYNTDPCDDGSLCTTMDTCVDGVCRGTAVDPDDGNVCTDDACIPESGVTHVPNTLSCEDGDACTVGDSCADSACVAGAARDCDDSDACTADSCDSASGCVHQDISASCDDGNVCTADSCDPATGCRNTVVTSFFCRPDIVVSYPPRAATIEAALPAEVTVTGTVTSGAGDITSFTINGDAVSVDPATGAFSYVMDAYIGSNVIELVAEDALGTTETVVQSYHWSTAYTLPEAPTPSDGSVDPGLGLWLDQQSIDDGSAPPPMDLAAVFESALAGLDLSPFYDPTTPIASSSGYDIYLTSLWKNGETVELYAIDGGLHVTAALLDVQGDLDFDCTNFTCLLAGGDSTGGLSIDAITIDADLMMDVNPDHTLSVTVTNQVTTITGVDIWSDNGWTNFLISLIEGSLLSGTVADLEAELNDQLVTVLGPLVEDGLSALAFNQVLDVPRLDGTTPPISVALASDFSFTDFQDPTPGPQGGAIGLRAWSTPASRGVPAGYPWDDNLGVPMRVACGEGTQAMTIPRIAPLEIVFPDDTLNQILRAAWWGGLLEFPLDSSAFAGVDLASYGVSNLDLVVSGWMPPVISDCGSAADLRMYVGDLRLDATMELYGTPLEAVIYVAFEAPISVGANASTGEIEITVSSVENVQLEVNVTDESMLGAQSALKSLLETELVPALGGLLGSGAPLTSFPLPEMDLSASLGQPPGTTILQIEPLSSAPGPTRQDGNTIVYGRLR